MSQHAALYKNKTLLPEVKIRFAEIFYHPEHVVCKGINKPVMLFSFKRSYIHRATLRQL